MRPDLPLVISPLPEEIHAQTGSDASESAEKHRQRSGSLGWVLEGGVLLALAWGLQHFGGIKLPGLDLLWVPVVLAAVRYGYWPGLATGATAGLVAIWPGLAGAVQPLALAPAPLFEGVALAVAGGLLGELRGAQDRKLRRVRKDLSLVREQLDTVQEHYEILERAKAELDRRVVGAPRTLEALYQVARAMDTLDEAAVLPAAIGILARFFDVSAAAAYEIQQPSGNLVIKADKGINPARRLTFAPEGLWQSAIEHGGSRMAASAEDIDSAGALLILPVKDPAGAVIALLGIEQIPFDKLTPNNLRLLETMADWTGRTWARARAHGQCAIAGNKFAPGKDRTQTDHAAATNRACAA